MQVMRAKPAILLVLIVSAALNLPDSEIPAQETTTIRAEVSLVNVVFTATDRRGRPVPNLKADDFRVFENRRLQKIEYFSPMDKAGKVPLTIAFLIDTSGSVRDKLEYEKTTAREFFKEVLRPNKDLALIIQFDSEVTLVQDFTQNTNVLISALDDLLKAGNSTSLYDAIFLAAEEKLRSEAGRKVMVVVTDGEDTASKVRKEEAIEAAQKSDAVIYGIGVRGKGYGTNFDVLEQFAEETGGAFFSPRAELDELREAFRSIGEDIRGQYSLAYSPIDKRKDGAFRTIEIRCKERGVHIRARKGYYAPKAERIIQ
jgi:VWFA-related protein